MARWGCHFMLHYCLSGWQNTRIERDRSKSFWLGAILILNNFSSQAAGSIGGAGFFCLTDEGQS